MASRRLSNEQRPKMSAKDRRVGIAMLAFAGAIIGLAIVVNISPSTGPGDTIVRQVEQQVQQAIPRASAVRDLVPCDSPILKHSIEEAMRAESRGNPQVAIDLIEKMKSTVFKEVPDRGGVARASHQEWRGHHRDER